MQKQRKIIETVVTFFVLPDKYKSDPRDTAGARSEQLGYSDGRSSH